MCKQHFIILLIGIFILSGCGQSENSKLNSDHLLAETESADTEFTKTEDQLTNDGNNEPSEDLPKPPEIPVNTKAVNTHYYCGNFFNLLSSVSICQSDGKKLYMVRSSSLDGPTLYTVPVGTDEFSPVNIDIPEGMNIYNFAFDAYGKIHLLMAAPDNQEYFIWRLDENHQVDKMIDISAYIEQERPPRQFLIHKDGSYFIQWQLYQNGIIVDSEGSLLHKFTKESIGTGWIQAAGVGKDGQIYLAHRTFDEKLAISKFDMENCLIENESSALYFPDSENFLTMSGGTDTNLLLLSPYSGVWACDTENNIRENRVPLSDIRSGFAAQSEYWLALFLPDGRLFLLGEAANDSHAEDADGGTSQPLILKYIPAGK